MTLGRTDKNKIKIKTDSPKGTRAVNCACCGGCGCATTISGDLLETLRVATTGTCNGVYPVYWDASEGGFAAVWEIGEFPDSTFYNCALSANVNCFSFGATDFISEMKSGPSGKCCPDDPPFPITCADVTYTINGDSFDAHTENSSGIIPPTFVFS